MAENAESKNTEKEIKELKKAVKDLEQQLQTLLSFVGGI